MGEERPNAVGQPDAAGKYAGRQSEQQAVEHVLDSVVNFGGVYHFVLITFRRDLAGRCLNPSQIEM